MRAKVQTIKFSEFMDGSYKAKPVSKPVPVLSISPFMILEPSVLIVGGLFLTAILFEKYLEHNGNFDVAEKLSVAINFSFLGVSAFVLFKLFSTIGGTFL